jgi:hypothetical protein
MTKSNYPSSGVAIIFLVAVVCLLPVHKPASAQDAPPWVDVDFSIQAKNFKNNLQGVSQIETEIERVITDLCSNYFPFLRWRIAGLAGPDIYNGLNLALTQEEAIPMPRIIVSFSCNIEKNSIKLPAIQSIIVHEAFDMDRPTQDPEKFILRVKSLLRQRFHNEDFRSRLHRDFLSSIPLSQRIIVAESEHLVVVPIKWELLKPGGDSVLYVDFVSFGEPGSEKSGTMKLSLIQKRWRAPSPGSVQGAIAMLNFAPLIIVNVGEWHEDIPLIFSGNVGLKVYMEKYVEKVNPDTLAGLVTRPD